MGETTGIEWTHIPGHIGSTWNPWYGCSKVSPGCASCYAEREMSRYGKDFTIVTKSKTTFYDPLKWKESHAIFPCSWSDFFHRKANPWREEAWEIILATPQHLYLMITKRPGLMAHWAKTHPWPDHVWAGTSVESTKYLPRLDVLERVPAKVRFVSVEPLLEVIDLLPYPQPEWVIIGGESGPHCRPMPLFGMRAIVAFCRWARIPVFVKQDSGPKPNMQGRIPDEYWIKEFPNVTTGREIRHAPPLYLRG